MRVFLSESVVNFGDLPLAPSIDGPTMAALAGLSLRTRDIPMHPEGVRKAHVSTSGIVWYVDYPGDRVSHFYLALSPSDTPEQPNTAFKGSIWLNTLELTAETTEVKLLRESGVRLEGHRHDWVYRAPNHYVSFTFERRRNRLGRRSGTHRLACVGITFSGAPSDCPGASGRRLAKTASPRYQR